MAGFCPIFDQDEVAVYKNVKKIKKKKRTRPICSHVDQTSLVKNRFLCACPIMEVFLAEPMQVILILLDTRGPSCLLG